MACGPRHVCPAPGLPRCSSLQALEACISSWEASRSAPGRSSAFARLLHAAPVGLLFLGGPRGAESSDPKQWEPGLPLTPPTEFLAFSAVLSKDTQNGLRLAPSPGAFFQRWLRSLS